MQYGTYTKDGFLSQRREFTSIGIRAGCTVGAEVDRMLELGHCDSHEQRCRDAGYFR